MTEAPKDADHEAIHRELRDVYAERFGPRRTTAIEAGRVRDYLLTLGRPGEVEDGDPVPPLFLLTLGRTRRPRPSRGSAVNAGDEFAFHRPVRVGDRITFERLVTDIETKYGRHGAMYLVRASATFTNQDGDLVAESHQVLIRWGLG